MNWRSSGSIEQDILLGPIHEKQRYQRGSCDSRNHGRIEASKEVHLDEVSIAISKLILLTLQDSIELTLPQLHLLIYISKKVQGLFFHNARNCRNKCSTSRMRSKGGMIALASAMKNMK